jgi:hypothetical protein
MSAGISECCVSGHLHDGKPTGAVAEIAGLKTYIAAPENGSKDKTILFIADIFGYQLPVSAVYTQLTSRTPRFWRTSMQKLAFMCTFLTSLMVRASDVHFCSLQRRPRS